MILDREETDISLQQVYDINKLLSLNKISRDSTCHHNLVVI